MRFLPCGIDIGFERVASVFDKTHRDEGEAGVKPVYLKGCMFSLLLFCILLFFHYKLGYIFIQTRI